SQTTASSNFKAAFSGKPSPLRSFDVPPTKFRKPAKRCSDADKVLQRTSSMGTLSTPIADKSRMKGDVRSLVEIRSWANAVPNWVGLNCTAKLETAPGESWFPDSNVGWIRLNMPACVPVICTGVAFEKTRGASPSL